MELERERGKGKVSRGGDEKEGKEREQSRSGDWMKTFTFYLYMDKC